jgi:Na+/proline symporter
MPLKIHPLDIAILAAYFLFVIGTGLWANRKVRNMEDY